MKKIILSLAIVTFTAATMTSCKKSYHCDCTGDGFGGTKEASQKLGKTSAAAHKSTCELGGCKWVTE